jgi:Pentapeptide repeats (8 copies)
MTLDMTLHENFLINFLRRHTVEEWNDWMKRLFDQNIVCPVWTQHEKPPPLTLSFDFRGADLRKLNLDGLDLTECDLTGTNFSHSSLRRARFRWCPAAVFIGADLRDAKFECGEISAVNFQDARLSGVQFDDVRYNVAMPPKGLPEHLMKCCKAEVEDA